MKLEILQLLAQWVSLIVVNHWSLKHHTVKVVSMYLFDLVADTGDWTSDTTYTLFINYDNLNLPLDSGYCFANGNFIGQYQHDEAGFNIENFPVLDGNSTVITVCAVGAPDCCDTFEFEVPNCEGSQICSIFDLVADTGICNGDSSYTLLVLYEVDNFTSDSVVISTEEGYSAHFEHDPDGITILDFPTNNTSHTTIPVWCLGNEDCCDPLN